MREKVIVVLTALICALPVACSSPEERAAAYLAKAQELYDEGDYTTARIEAMNAAQIQPRNADVRYLLSEIEESEQNFRQAIGHLQVAVDADETHLPSRIKLGNYYVLAKAVDEADEQATAAEGIAPDDPEVLLLRARVLYLQDDTDGALAQIDRTLEADPGLVEATMFKAGMYVARQEFDNSLELVDMALADADGEDVRQLRQFRIILLRSAERNEEVETDLKSLMEDFPDEEGYAVTLAQLYISEDRTDEAEEVLRKVVAADPTDVDRRIGFVRFLAAQRGPDEAEAALKEFVAEMPDSSELKLALGQFYESRDDQEQAFAIYEEIAQAEPATEIGLTARNRIVAFKVRENELDEAKSMIAGILETEPDNTDALLVRAAFSFTDKDYDSAVADLRTVLRTDPQSERGLLLLARSHVGAGSLELAQDAYRRLIEVQPNHPLASNELADLLARSGEPEQAEEVLRRKLELAPKDRRSASNLVEALLLQGEMDAAEEEVRNLMEFDDPSGLAEFQLGRVMQAKSSGDEAIAAYKSALEKNPNATQALQGLTAALVDSGNPDEAIEYLTGHVNAYPEQVSARLLLGAVHARVGERDQAEAQFEKVIELQPNANRAYASLASLYPEDADARIKIYERGFSTNETDATLGFLLATEYERAQQWDKAVGVYESLVESDPNNDIAINNLAALLLDQRSDAASFERALELASRFSDSEEPALVDTLGWAYYRTGDFQQAVRYLELANSRVDNVAQLRYHLGMAYLKNGNSVQARAELEKALELAQQDFVGIDEARATLEQLQETATAGN
ncbi:MAG: tetratricopeptide repeat protein [Gammaproteobacteria bacterium]|nr:tetratricopeptide repeat protein [Gammaproteobacteria bacterium]